MPLCSTQELGSTCLSIQICCIEGGNIKLAFYLLCCMHRMRDHASQFLNLCRIRTGRLILWMWMMSLVVIAFQTFMFYSRCDMSYFIIPLIDEELQNEFLSPKSTKIGKSYLLHSLHNSSDRPMILEEADTTENMRGKSNTGIRIEAMAGETKKDSSDDYIPTYKDEVSNGKLQFDGGVSKDLSVIVAPINSLYEEHRTDYVASSEKRRKEALLKKEETEQGFPSLPNFISTYAGISWVKKKMAPIYLPEMNSLLLQSRAYDQSMRPRWSLACDKQILSAKEDIQNAPLVQNDRELYVPLFRNISMFKRSYELMEQKLKIYVYREGENPIFHHPLLKGIYASEGWFMKLIESDRHFVVKDPSKALLYYLPFSSRQLQFALYTEESHYKSDLEQYLMNYLNTIATKYPFWNRTGGADHFLVACHDWAPFETRHTMGHSIRALCNADLRSGFRLGIDVSLPETNVVSPLNPLRGLGGSPATKRHTLAFFAGKMHGGLRPKLLRHWENKDPDMKIFGLLPGGENERKMNYIRYMKTSKYCICPRGHEVNSPRVIEAIFYECVPVIVSNNYVLPFFEVLNWLAFSVVVPEKHVPRLKQILESIPEEKYIALQKGVKKVQKHFLWHRKPVKYDLFHMILHSIWFNRLHQM